MKSKGKYVSDVDMANLMSCVYSRVEQEIFGEVFPKRIELWEHMKSCPDQLHNLVDYSVKEYVQLYKTCASVSAKDCELFLRWLDIMRYFTCEEHYNTTSDRGTLRYWYQ